MIKLKKNLKKVMVSGALVLGMLLSPKSVYAQTVTQAMSFFNAAVGALQVIVIAIGAVLAVWGIINLLEGYGNDNAGAKSQGAKQLVAGGGICFIGISIIPLLSGLF